MESRGIAKRLGHRGYLAVGLLAIALVGFATIVTAWHNDGSDRDCPFCQIANLPVIKPAAAAQLPPPTYAVQHVSAPLCLQELEATHTSGSPRAPPSA